MSSQRPVEVVPVFMSAIHGDRDKEFRKTAPSRGVIKEGRREQTLCCTKCGRWDENEGVKLRQCIGCKVVFYCSKECQKEDWPFHKQHCEEGLGEGIQPLIKSVTGNPMLSHYLQVCLSLQFRLHQLHLVLSKADRDRVIRSPLFAHIDVGIEPTKIAEFMNLYHFKDEWDSDDMDGMLQFHDLVSPWPGMPERKPTNMQLDIWRRCRKAADEDGDNDCAVVLVQFVNNFKQAITCPIVVDKEAVDTARRAPTFSMVSALSGKEIVLQMSIASCFEYMNSQIRADKNDRFRLRAPMRESDKELIRNAGKKDVENFSVRALRVKIGREYVYKSHTMEEIEEDRRKVAEARRAQAAPTSTVGEERRIEGPAENEEAEQPNTAPKMNRAERRRLERELKKEQKRRR